MKRPFGMIFTSLWKNPSFKKLEVDAKLLAVYLCSCPHGNAAHLFHLPVMYAAYETGLDQESVRFAYDELEKVGFCYFDEDSEYVWCREGLLMQWYRGMKETDNNVQGFVNILNETPARTLVQLFLQEFAVKFHLVDNPFLEVSDLDI